MSLNTCITDGWRQMPSHRIDLAGDREQPMTIQWAYASEDMAGYLLADGWERPPDLDLKNILEMLSPDMPVDRFPVLPRLHDGRADSLRLVRQIADERWVLRLWPTDVRIAENNTPLFVGTIEIQRQRHFAGLISAIGDARDYDRALETLKRLLGGRLALKTVLRKPDDLDERMRRRLRWEGRVLLMWRPD